MQPSRSKAFHHTNVLIGLQRQPQLGIRTAQGLLLPTWTYPGVDPQLWVPLPWEVWQVVKHEWFFSTWHQMWTVITKKNCLKLRPQSCWEPCTSGPRVPAVQGALQWCENWATSMHCLMGAGLWVGRESNATYWGGRSQCVERATGWTWWQLCTPDLKCVCVCVYNHDYIIIIYMLLLWVVIISTS